MARWSPDGQQIAFMGALPGKAERIYLMASNGGTAQQVTSGESGEAILIPSGLPMDLHSHMASSGRIEGRLGARA